MSAADTRGGSTAWFRYVFFGAFFGLVLAKGEVISWFRIQEMFRFQGFHMYGVLGSGVVVAAASVWLIKRAEARSMEGEPISIADKDATPLLKRYWIGGGCFGLGWGLLGACPGPIYTLMGGGVTVMVVALAAALLGTVAYAALERSLPH